MEIPSWQIPHLRSLGRKLWLRMKEYLCDALPLILCGVLFVDLMQMSGITDWVTKLSRYPVEYILGLPADTTSLLILGFLRKDVAIALLEPFNLSAQMLVVACVFMTMYLPCIATFFVMLRESGWKDTLRVVALTLTLALVTGFILRLILL
jgi:ferrous iron transport protein B